MFNIDSFVNSGNLQQGFTNYNENVIVPVETEKGGNSMVNLNEGMTTKEVAEFIGVSERTVRNICKEKKLAHYKVGTKIVVLPDDLKNYINSLKIEKEEKEI